jgi:hypothetical protein
MAQDNSVADDSRIQIGPDGQGSYRYSIDGVLSVPFYNAASARAAAKMPQRVNKDDLLEPRV